MKFYKHKQTGEIATQFMVPKSNLYEYDEMSAEDTQAMNNDLSERHLSRIAGDVATIKGIVVILFILGIIGVAITILGL
jgi:hypothetical protein